LENYFNYFTDIEEHFQRRRGTILLLSTLDWALIETWKDAGIPLEAVLRGIDSTFDKWEKRPSKTRKVNGLGFCAQEVLAAAEGMKEAEVGATRPAKPDSTLPADEVATYLGRNADLVEKSRAGLPHAAQQLATETVATLRELASQDSPNFEDVERRLTVLEDKLLAALLAATPDEAIMAARADADRELSAYRRTMSAAQIDQLLKQYIHKRLLERYGLPRLSLFYMQ
jgi:hypothetical protein